MSETVLVTGGGGFIGTWVLRDLLKMGLSPLVFDVQKNTERWHRILGDEAKRVHFVAGSLLDRQLLNNVVVDQRVSRIIHLAALLTPGCQQDPYVGCEVNVLGSVGLFELARTHVGQIRGISYASSYAVYGPEADDRSQLPSDECNLSGAQGKAADVDTSSQGLTSADNRPPSFYGAFKLAFDLIAEQYWRHFGIASVGIRPHVAYGPERTVGLTAGPSQAARAAALGLPYSINYRGCVGYDYVEDVARAFVRSALETPPGSTVVDLPSQLATTEEFVEVIERVVPGSSSRITIDGPSIPSNIPPKPHFISEIFSDWRPMSLDEGVRRTVEFYRNHKPE